jgi:hypothetical protein
MESVVNMKFSVMDAVTRIIFNFSFKLLAVCVTHLQNLTPAPGLPQHRVTKLSPRPASAEDLKQLFLDSMELW